MTKQRKEREVRRLTILSIESNGKHHDITFVRNFSGFFDLLDQRQARIRANTVDNAVKHLSDRYRCTYIIRADQAGVEAPVEAAA